MRPTGSGAGAGGDGQVLVWHDLLGLYDGRTPRFVKQYADLKAEIARALEAYAADVRSGAFPEERHTYAMPEEELARFSAQARGPSETTGRHAGKRPTLLLGEEP